MLTLTERFVLFAWALAGILVAVFWFAPVSAALRNNYSDYMLNIIPLLGAFYCFRTALAFPSGNPMRLVWLFIALGVTAWAFGSIIASVYIKVFSADPPYPSLADIGYLAMPVFFITALILFKRSIHIKTPMWGWIAAAIAFIAAIALYFATTDLAEWEGMSFVVNTLYLLFDPILVFITVFILSSLFGGRVGAAWWYLLIGVLLYFIGNQLYMYFTYLGTNELSSPINMLWVFGFGFMAIAAMITYHQFTGDGS